MISDFSILNNEFDSDTDDAILIDLVDGTISNLDISFVKSKISGPVSTITINASIQEICKMGLSKTGFQQYILLKDSVDTIKVKVSEDLIHKKLGIDGKTARSIRKTNTGTGELVQMLADWYSWLEKLKDYEFVLRVGDGNVEWI